jgi:hypothetical protein
MQQENSRLSQLEASRLNVETAKKREEEAAQVSKALQSP